MIWQTDKCQRRPFLLQCTNREMDVCITQLRSALIPSSQSTRQPNFIPYNDEQVLYTYFGHNRCKWKVMKFWLLQKRFESLCKHPMQVLFNRWIWDGQVYTCFQNIQHLVEEKNKSGTRKRTINNLLMLWKGKKGRKIYGGKKYGLLLAVDGWFALFSSSLIHLIHFFYLTSLTLFLYCVV